MWGRIASRARQWRWQGVTATVSANESTTGACRGWGDLGGSVGCSAEMVQQGVEQSSCQEGPFICSRSTVIKKGAEALKLSSLVCRQSRRAKRPIQRLHPLAFSALLVYVAQEPRDAVRHRVALDDGRRWCLEHYFQNTYVCLYTYLCVSTDAIIDVHIPI